MVDEINWRRIRTYHELELPPHRDLGLPTQKWTLRIPENYIFLNPRRTRYGVFTFRGWQQPARDSEPLAQFVHNDTSDMILLSNQQITELVKQGRIRPVMGPDDGPRNRPGSSFAVDGEARERAEKRLAYADAMEEEMRRLKVRSLTDKQKERVVREVAEHIGDKDPPKRTKWYEILKTSRKGNQFDRLLDFVDHHENKGNRTLRYGRAVAAAIRAAAEEAVSLNGDWKSVRSILIRTIKPNGINYHLREQIVDEDGNFKIQDRKMQRTLGQLNHYVRDFLLEGPDYAERIHQRYLSQVRPDAPLAVVDVDHSTLDIVVFDSEYPIAYGRPDIVLFRDRFSGIVIGFAISFGAPSYQTFLEGLKHMIFEKDPLNTGVPWPWHGVPVELGADNAKHLQGINIRGAARELGFRLKAYRPGRPWEKGAEEHLFAILGRKIHRLPGSTESTHDRRDDFDEEKERAKPILSIQELYGFLNFYFASIHHYKPTAGLGPLATLKGVPAERWADEIANAPDAPIIDPDVLIRLAGDINEVTISEIGVRLDYIVYNCAELLVLTTNPEHYAGRKYQARRDPADLGMLRIKNPYVQAEHWIDVPAREADLGYARGMKLWAHRIIIKHLRDQAKESDRRLTLIEAQVELETKLADVHANRKKYNTAQLMARFYNSNLQKEERSRITEMGRVEYSEGRLNLAAMPEIEVPERVNVRSVAVMPSARKTPVTEQKATVTRTIAGEHIPEPTFDKTDDGLPDDLADWDL